MSPFTQDGAVYVVAGGLLAWGIARRPRRLSVDRIVTLAVFALLAFWARRNAAWFGMALIPSAAILLSDAMPAPAEGPTRNPLYAAILTGFGAVALLALPFWRRDVRSDETPERAMAFLCADAGDGARVFQEETFGVYQIWRCPRLPVYIDTRYELYPMDQWLEYVAVSGGDRAAVEATAQRHRLTHFFLSTTSQAPAITALSRLPGWTERYRDERAVIFARSEPTSLANSVPSSLEGRVPAPGPIR